MKKLIASVAGLVGCLLALASVAQAADVGVLGVRMWPAPDSSRIVFDVSGPVRYKVFRLDNPDRVVVDFSNASLKTRLPSPSQQDRITQRVRHAVRGQDDLRIVLDVSQPIDVKSFLLEPNEHYGHRLVLDLVKPQAARDPVVTHNVQATPDTDTPREIVIAIDAGHGGEDPGARGYAGNYEKDLVLAIARRLQSLVANEPGMRPVMIRDGDYFISLRNRTLKARAAKADLFVSIHADAFHDQRVRGSSLYVLSQGGASNEAARWLAERENASDLIGGVSLDNKDNVLKSVLLDLSQSATIEASFEAGDAILRHMSPLGRVHKPRVQQAGFAVLKSPDIPSVLIETAFISNPEDESKLRNDRHQQAVAEAIFRGLKDYFNKHPPAGTLYAVNRRHIISRGDTLSQLAQQYRVSVDNLRIANNLKNDVLRIGQVLQIPPG